MRDKKCCIDSGAIQAAIERSNVAKRTYSQRIVGMHHEYTKDVLRIRRYFYPTLEYFRGGVGGIEY